MNISELDSSLVIYFNKAEYKIPSASVELQVNGRAASPGTIIEEGAAVRYMRSERKATTVSDALLAVNFQPPAATSRVTFKILVNQQPAEFPDPIKNGDTLDVIIEPLDEKPISDTILRAAQPSTTAAAAKPAITIESLMRRD